MCMPGVLLKAEDFLKREFLGWQTLADRRIPTPDCNDDNCNKHDENKIVKGVDKTEDTLSLDQLREVTVYLAELAEMVEAFESVGKAENQGAFNKEQDQRDGVRSLHFLGIL